MNVVMTGVGSNPARTLQPFRCNPGTPGNTHMPLYPTQPTQPAFYCS